MKFVNPLPFCADLDRARAFYRDIMGLRILEDEDIYAAFTRIAPHVEMIHPVERQHWGQRVFRFYDPDGHIVEIGAPV